ncbi:MAG: sel1 repeat family protein [Pseudomonadota bacterium]|nr:MAG: sel1 repeat family protein [Pseudomonadota bacterium]
MGSWRNMYGQNSFLSELVLWRHDPALVDTLRAQARSGNRDARYALGLVYAEGRGARGDSVEAYAWLTLAMAQGDNDAELLRQIVMESMTVAEVQAGERRAEALSGGSSIEEAKS